MAKDHRKVTVREHSRKIKNRPEKTAMAMPLPPPPPPGMRPTEKAGERPLPPRAARV